MRSAHSALIAVTLLSLLALVSRADQNDDVRAFCQRADADFQNLVQSCRSDRREYWQKRSQEATQQYLAKSQELQQTSAMLGREPNGKELQAVFAFEYLNQSNEIELTSKTKLVEDLGLELLRDRTDAKLSPALSRLEVDFASLKNGSKSAKLQDAYAAFLDLTRRASSIVDGVPIKYKYVFEPKANAYSEKPEKVAEYVIHDWSAGFKQVDDLQQRLQSIRDNVDTALFFTPKDPIPWLPVATQLTFLMVAMGGWIKSYHSEQSYWAIGLLVIPSMVASVFLVFYSKETLWNIARQSLIPGAFILYWMGRKNQWVARFRKFLWHTN
jgi:hypothetical protein